MRKRAKLTILVMAAIVASAAIPLACTKGQANEPTAEETAKLSAELRAVLEKNLQAYTDEDLDAMIATVNTKSPMFGATVNSMKVLVAQYDLKYELESFKYFGRDAEYAVVRVKQKTTKVAGPAFNDNILDAMHIYRQDDKKQWKLWQTAILDVEYLQAKAP